MSFVPLPPAPPAIVAPAPVYPKPAPLVYRIEIPRPHTGQEAILKKGAKYNVVACGRRFGKTILGTNRLIDKALQGFPVAWFAPNYKLLGPVWRDVLRRLKPVIKHVDKTERRIELVSGGVIEFWTLDGDDPARGREYALVVVDEAAMVADLADLWEACIEPTLMTFDGGAWFLSTPKGLNFFHVLWQRGLDPGNPDWASHRAPSLANVTLPNAEKWLANKKKTVDERRFQQEYLAEFLSGEGAVFRRVGVAACSQMLLAALAGRQYVGGIDFGRNHDYTVVTIMDMLSGEVVYLDRFTGIEFIKQQERIKAIWQRFQCTVILCESNSFGASNIEALQAMGVPVMPFATTQTSKNLIIDQLTLALEQEQIKIPPVEWADADGNPFGQIMSNELLAFEGKKTAGGMMSYNAPSGFNDDCVISLALCWYARQFGGVGTQESFF